MRLRILSFLMLFLASSLVLAQDQQRLEVDIAGMSCKFCVHNVEKNLSKLEGVEKVSVNLDKGIALIVMSSGKKADIKQIKKLVKKAGFTPSNVREIKSND